MTKIDDCILLVDDEEMVVKSLRRALIDEDYEVFSAQSGKDALTILADRHIKVIVCDERMPEMSGAELLSIISRRYPSTVRIMLTGHATLESAMKAVNEGEITRFFSKPWNDLELKFAIRAAIEKYDQDLKVRELMALVRTQQFNIKHLKKTASGTCSSRADEERSFYMPELTDQDIDRILKECESN